MTGSVLAVRPDGYEIDVDPTRLDVDRVHRWIATDSYWAGGRPRDVMDRAVAGSLSFGLYGSAGQVGFLRAVTDQATFAYLADVYVERSVRGAGLGTWFVRVACDHLRGTGVRRITLVTADAHGLYAKLGFTPLHQPERWMENLASEVRLQDG